MLIFHIIEIFNIKYTSRDRSKIAFRNDAGERKKIMMNHNRDHAESGDADAYDLPMLRLRRSF